MTTNISSRGESLAKKKPVFLDVLADIWDPLVNPTGVVNLGLAENIHIDSHALTYGDGFSGSQKLKKAICHFLNRQLSPFIPLHSSHVTVTSGVSNALECTAWALFDQGDHVLVSRPYFNAFHTTFSTRAGVGLLEVKLGEIDPFTLAAVENYEEALLSARKEGMNVKALLLCSPHNPLGRCYPEHVLREYMRLCGKYDLHLISDEIYALSVWESPDLPEAVSFKSILSIDTAGLIDGSMVHAVWGLSKDFGATGLRIGCLISQSNHRLLEAADGISYGQLYSSEHSVAASLLADDGFTTQYLRTNQLRLAESYKFVTAFLKRHEIPYSKCNATFFLWIRLGAVVKDPNTTDDEVSAKLRKFKVYMAAGYAYASEERGWFRMVFAHPRPVLEEGLQRVAQALDL
ncbi:hypothetical protein N7478_004865 [Penicillium angulare]|uniref:uncharacterized protein n=1 Tax=Penicillium angulare TaxID=116970 RepID=UPI0025404DDE|nr:uncharacterized protein N7478_004865 [Penicillium angulare]KAJ5279493.1 hypothetical protein N7478_004865 [Penicillium angulare]